MKNVFLFLVLLIITPIFSFEVNRGFLEEQESNYIEFDNYVGPYLFYNTVSEIRQIGSFLANNITPTIKGTGNYFDKYKLHHRPKLEWEDKPLSCDVFEITDIALIDNIENVKLILSQYLIDNYGYSIDDGDLLAHLLLVYNAVFRGDPSHFTEIYTSEGVLSQETNSLGIDIHFFNWPGKTFIYIPLSNNLEIGKLSNVDTDILVDDKVIEHITVEDENNIEIREDIIDFKEREFDEITNELSEDKEELNELNITVDQDNGDKEINEESLGNDIEEKESIIEDKITELKEKDEKILELRDSLAEDKNELIVDNNKKTTDPGFLYILNRFDANSFYGQLLNLSTDGSKLNNSIVNSIRNNSFNKKGDSIYIIAGGKNANQIITLGKLKSDTLTLDKWADVVCYENSPIIIQGDNIYSVIYLDNKYYLGEFDIDLKIQRRSSKTLFKDSFIVLKNNIFYIQGESNNIILIDLSDFIPVL